MDRRCCGCQGRDHAPKILLYSTEVTIQTLGNVSMCQKPRVRGRRQRRCRHDILLSAKDEVLSFCSFLRYRCYHCEDVSLQNFYRYIPDAAPLKLVFGFSQSREMARRCLICVIAICNSKDEEATQWLQIMKETPQARVWQTCVSRD